MTRKDSEFTKEVLRHSTDGAVPDMDAMLGATTSMLQQARRASASRKTTRACAALLCSYWAGFYICQ